MGMARFTCGGSPSLSDATPMTSPAALTTALPPHAGLDGDTMKARSSMYSQKLEKRLTACTEPVTWTRSLSSSTPTVPVNIPLVTSRDSPSRADGHDRRLDALDVRGAGRDVLRMQAVLAFAWRGQPDGREHRREQQGQDQPSRHGPSMSGSAIERVNDSRIAGDTRP